MARRAPRSVALPVRSVGRRATVPRRGLDLAAFAQPRTALLALVLLTYVWRFHDLNPVIAILRLAAIATVLTWCFLVFSPRLHHLIAMLARPGVAFLVLGVMWTGVTVPFALSPDLAWESWWGTHFKTFTMFLFLLTCFTSFRAVKQAMVVHVFGAAVLAAYYAKGGFPLWGSPVPMYDVNDLALHLNMAIPFVLFFAMRSRGRRARAALWGLMGLMTVCALMTQSRGAFLTIGVLATIILLSASTLKLWMRCIPPILVVCTYVFAPPATKARLSTLFSPTEDYNMDDERGRIEIWKRGLGYMREHPVMGVGMSNFPLAEATLSPQARSARSDWRAMVSHNSFIEIGSETGYPGLVLFTAMLLLPLIGLIRIRSRLRRHVDRIADGQELVLAAEVLTLSLVAYCIGGFFLSMAYVPIMYSLIAMIAGFDVAVERMFRPAPQARMRTG